MRGRSLGGERLRNDALNDPDRMRWLLLCMYWLLFICEKYT
jgi:hypothetical protein